MNYENNNFSISQAAFSKDTPSHIVPIAAVQSATTAPTSPSNTASSTLPPITKVTSPPSHSSHSLATPAIAGIAIAIVVILFVGAFGVWLKFKRKRSRKDTAELAADAPRPRDKAELAGETTHQPGSSNEKKGPGVSVAAVSDEKMQAQIDQDEIRIMDNPANHSGHGVPAEIGTSDPFRPELDGHNSVAIHELPSREGELIRSELSTPEPGWLVEMPSPEMSSSEMPSPEIGGPRADEPSSQLDTFPSPLSSPDSMFSRKRSFSHRPNHGRGDSSDSEGGWARDRMHSAPGGRPYPPSRINSNESSESQQHGLGLDRNLSSASSRQRLVRSRVDSSDSESSGPNVSQGQRSLQQSRPAHGRNNSTDTMETRLAGNSYFPSTTYPARDRHIEAVPSIGYQSSQETLTSPGVMSTRPGLRVSEPLDREVKEEEEDQDERPSSEASKKQSRSDDF